MSIDALQWAFKQKAKCAQDKFILVALAERANEDFECWPSVKRLHHDTQLNRKTIIKCLDRLEQCGFIADTGERRGKTASVKIYRLVGAIGREESSTKSGTASKAINAAKKATSSTRKAVPKAGPLSSTENGTAKQTQKRDRLKAEAVPNAGPLSSTESGTVNLKENIKPMVLNSQSLVIPPEAPRNEPATETPPGFETFEIPEWLDANLWAGWEAYRRNRIAKPWDDVAKARSIGELFKANQQGQNLSEVIANAMRRHWEFPYPLKSCVGSDIPITQIVDLYNTICVKAGMLPCNDVHPERTALIVRRVREAGMTLDDWEVFFRHAAKKPELTGKSKPRDGYAKPFRAQIDHLLNNKGFSRLDEEIAKEHA